MLNQIFATKLSMTQAWTVEGRRLPVTRCKVEPNQVLTVKSARVQTVNEAGRKELANCQIAEIGYGAKKLTQMTKPLATQVTKAGFQNGVKQIRGLRELGDTASVTVGSTLTLTDILQIGDVVEVQGTTKGKGFAGVMKRHNFHGGPATHGQSDRARAPGSIGQRTQPGRVHKGHRMAGHMGNEQVTVSGLIVLHIDPTTQEIWLSGPIPGANNGLIRLSKTGENRDIKLDQKASGIVAPVAQSEEENAAPTAEVEATPVVETEAATTDTAPAAETQTEKQEA